MSVSSSILQIETSAAVGGCPWGIGVEVSNDLTPAQMMAKAGVDWKVEKVPTFAHFNNQSIPTGKEALIRTSDGSVLTQVGGNWNPCQNEEAFNFFNEYCLAGDMEMNAAGSLKDGKMVWALAKVKDSFDALPGDQIDSYMLFSNPHEYGKSIDIRFTPIRVTCMNTLALALNTKAVSSAKINHRRAFDPEQVKITLGLANEKFEKFKEVSKILSRKQFKMNELIQYYNTIYPAQGQVTKVDDLAPNARKAYDVLETQPGAEYGRGTWWQAFNSVTYIADHQVGRSADSRMTSSWYGSNQRRKKRAVELAVEMATA